MSLRSNSTLALAASEAAHALRDTPHTPTRLELEELFTPVERAALFTRPIDMWPQPDPIAEHQRRRDAVAAVLTEVELLDELIAAAQTGI